MSLREARGAPGSGATLAGFLSRARPIHGPRMTHWAYIPRLHAPAVRATVVASIAGAITARLYTQ